jgi:hypothetical protein
MMKMVVEPVHGACQAHVLHWGAWDFRTLRRYFLDFVLPVLTLAAMSALTVVMLVLLVSAVAEIELYSQSREATPDPWSAACFGPAFLWDREAYPEYSARMDALDWDVVSQAEPWPGSQ